MSFKASAEGGLTVAITGVFPVNVALEVFIGPNNDATDPPCYGGEGYGYFPRSLDGVSLVVVTPPLPVGASFLNWRTVGGLLNAWGGVEVIDRNWRLRTLRIRGLFPPWCGVGARRLELEP